MFEDEQLCLLRILHIACINKILILQWSFEPDLETDENRGGRLEKNATVPYFLTMASQSNVLLTTLCDTALEISKSQYYLN